MEKFLKKEINNFKTKERANALSRYIMLFVLSIALAFSSVSFLFNKDNGNIIAHNVSAYSVQDNGDVVPAESKAISTVSQLKIFMSGDANQGVAGDASYATATDGHLTQ
ncbi:MAG: hypothetical protein RR334_03115, partial [Clostridia bacterium]